MKFRLHRRTARPKADFSTQLDPTSLAMVFLPLSSRTIHPGRTFQFCPGQGSSHCGDSSRLINGRHFLSKPRYDSRLASLCPPERFICILRGATAPQGINEAVAREDYPFHSMTFPNLSHWPRAHSLLGVLLSKAHPTLFSLPRSSP